MLTHQTNTYTQIISAGGVAYQFPVPFHDPSELTVAVRDNEVGSTTLLSFGADYTLPPQVDYLSSGVAITLKPAVRSAYDGKTLVATRRVPLNQLLDLPLAGRINTESLERMLDRLVMMAQQLQEQLGRTLQYPQGAPYDQEAAYQFFERMVNGIDGWLQACERAVVAETNASASEQAASGHMVSASGYMSRASGYMGTASGHMVSASGYMGTASGYMSTASGYMGTASGHMVSASGYMGTASGHMVSASGYMGTASGYMSRASGYMGTASGHMVSASGYMVSASGYMVSASGYQSNASVYMGTAFGYMNTASGYMNTAGSCAVSAFVYMGSASECMSGAHGEYISAKNEAQNARLAAEDAATSALNVASKLDRRTGTLEVVLSTNNPDSQWGDTIYGNLAGKLPRTAPAPSLQEGDAIVYFCNGNCPNFPSRLFLKQEREGASPVGASFSIDPGWLSVDIPASASAGSGASYAKPLPRVAMLVYMSGVLVCMDDYWLTGFIYHYYTRYQVDSLMADKAALSHSHVQSDVTGLEQALEDAAAARAELGGRIQPLEAVLDTSLADDGQLLGVDEGEPGWLDLEVDDVGHLVLVAREAVDVAVTRDGHLWVICTVDGVDLEIDAAGHLVFSTDDAAWDMEVNSSGHLSLAHDAA